MSAEDPSDRNGFRWPLGVALGMVTLALIGAWWLLASSGDGTTGEPIGSPSKPTVSPAHPSVAPNRDGTSGWHEPRRGNPQDPARRGEAAWTPSPTTFLGGPPPPGMAVPTLHVVVVLEKGPISPTLAADARQSQDVARHHDGGVRRPARSDPNTDGTKPRNNAIRVTLFEVDGEFPFVDPQEVNERGETDFTDLPAGRYRVRAEGQGLAAEMEVTLGYKPLRDEAPGGQPRIHRGHPPTPVRGTDESQAPTKGENLAGTDALLGSAGKLPPEPQTVILTLKPVGRGELVIQVADGTTGNPISGAIVKLAADTDPEAHARLLHDHTEAGLRQATSDEAGLARFADLPAAGYLVVVRHRGHRVTPRVVRLDDGESKSIEIRLPRQGYIAGIVKTQDGGLVGGATVTVTWDRRNVYSTQSDAEGRFTFFAAEGDAMQLEARKGDLYSGVVVPSCPDPMAECAVELIVTGQPGFTVRVVAEAGGEAIPLPRACLDPLLDTHQPRCEDGDFQGVVAFQGLRPGRYIPRAFAEGFAESAGEAFEFVAGRERQEIVVRLAKSACVSGQVLDEAGQGQMGATVRAVEAESDEEETTGTRGRGAWRARWANGGGFGEAARLRPPILSGEGGTFRVCGLGAGTWSVSATLSPGDVRWPAVEVRLRGGENLDGVVLKPDPTLLVTGRVETPDGRAVTDIMVFVVPGPFRRPLALDGDGRFAVRMSGSALAEYRSSGFARSGLATHEIGLMVGRPPAIPLHMAAKRVVPALPGAVDFKVVLDEGRYSAELSLTLGTRAQATLEADPGGRIIAILQDPADDSRHLYAAFADGRATLPKVEPGDYILRIHRFRQGAETLYEAPITIRKGTQSLTIDDLTSAGIRQP